MNDTQLYSAIELPIVANAIGFSLLSVRIGDLHRRLDDLRSEINQRFASLEKIFDAKLARVEEVLDARLRHLEER